MVLKCGMIFQINKKDIGQAFELTSSTFLILQPIVRFPYVKVTYLTVIKEIDDGLSKVICIWAW